MELTPLATKILALTLSSLQDYIIEMSQLMQQNAKGAAIAFTTLYLMWIGVEAMVGRLSSDRIKELFYSALILMSIVSAVLGSSFYVNNIVIPYVKGLINTASWFASKGSVNNFIGIFNHLDNGFALIYTQLMNKIPDGNLMTNAGEYISAWVAVGVFSVSYGLMYICFLVLIILSLFVIYVLFVIGIVCIFLSAFKETRHVFWAWVKAIANYSMMMVFAAIVMSVAYQGVESSLSLYANILVEQGVFNAEFASLVVWSLVCFGILLKVPDLASALTGGVAGATTGIASIGSLAGAAVFSSVLRSRSSSSSSRSGNSMLSNIRGKASKYWKKAGE
ncbi:type IV secretion system protein [Maridesulfovibrio sp.]|uniref:type IV secretion system protein n=1 Tax=Maridesulfovibrio sp. TaxID=2795000 RepID=UPI002A18885C|nr:type IV secretion system protein [Maridesulfovibrio sp.]